MRCVVDYLSALELGSRDVITLLFCCFRKTVERAAGIEPACLTWKDSALPLSYARFVRDKLHGKRLLTQAFFNIF